MGAGLVPPLPGPAEASARLSGATALYLALGVGAFAVGSVLRLRGEETAGRTEVLLATASDRRRYLGGGLAVTAVASTLLLVAAGLGTGLAAAAVRGNAGLVGTQLGAQLVHLPAVLVTTGVAAALVALAPRLSALAWVVLAWAVLVGLFGALLGLPEWMQQLSPFGWTPAVPAEPFDVVPVGGLTLATAALATLTLAAFRRRDLPA